MKLMRVTYFALATLISAASCSKEAAEPDVYKWDDGKIYFRPSLADVVSSRAQDVTLDHLESFQVTCFNTGDVKKDAAGFVSPYFENATFIRQVSPSSSVTYVSSPAEGSHDWPANSGVLKFFAFSPSLDVMMAGNSAVTDVNRSEYFNLKNSSVESNSNVVTDYRLGTVRVNPDISNQFDFITAEVSGERWKDFTTGVELAFRHQMCQVELKAWGANSDYNFEIAGVRLGNPVVEGTFVFSDAANPDAASAWATTDDPVVDKVDYLYRGAELLEGEDQHGSGDAIFNINNIEHNDLTSAASIMGRGGCAMVLPTVNQKWEGRNDPNISLQPYTTRRMYFSILMRVSASSGGRQLYPYPNPVEGMTVIYYAVNSSGNIVTRVYPGTIKGEFFTDSDLQDQYMAPVGVEIKEFGWAAVPVDADWCAGKRYVYTLNYSEGIGMHDPQDPEPGKPIVGKSAITWGMSVGTWQYAAENDDYHPDINVP